MPGEYGINHRGFEQKTGLREDDEVEYRIGTDGLISKGIIKYSWVGAGFDVVSLYSLDGKYKDSLHWECGYGLWNRKPTAMMIYYKGKRVA